MEYKLIKEKRKTLSLQLEKDGTLLVKAPIKASMQVIENFIASKKRWIEKREKELKEREGFKNSFNFDKCLYIFGKEYNFAEVDMALIGANREEIDKYYYKLAGKKLLELAKTVSQEVGLGYKTLKLTSSHRVWGSYDRKGNMKLNYRLIILPENIARYVIIHELCHGKELNHSKAFWDCVAQNCPKYKEIKKELDLYAFLLQ